MKPTLLFHVQHFLGMGHLVRAFALAAELRTNFRVVVVSGGRLPAGIVPPDGIDVAHLPALGFDPDRMLVSLVEGRTVEQVQADRTARLLDAFESTDPDVLLIELFPFGRKKLAGELVALLERASGRANRPLVATSLRDLLVTGRHDQQRHDDRAADFVSRYFDLVLVHGDRRFVSLDESFRPHRPLRVPVEYTGFVGPPDQGDPVPPEIVPGTVVVSAGGGWVGGALMRASLDAAPILADRHGLETTLIAGPLADPEAWAELVGRTQGTPAVRLVRSVPGLLPTLRESAASISQAGYNTCIDLLRARVPAVLVPYGDERENEQPRRADRFAEHGLASVVNPAGATGQALADAVSASLAAPMPKRQWDLDGARRSSIVLWEALAAPRRRAV